MQELCCDPRIVIENLFQEGVIMKKIIIAAFSTVLLTSHSFAANKTVVLKNVHITVCGQVPGCAPRIYEDGDRNNYLIDQKYAQEFLNKHQVEGNAPENHVAVKEALGVVVKEKGHFPNPTVEFEVFKAISIFE